MFEKKVFGIDWGNGTIIDLSNIVIDKEPQQTIIPITPLTVPGKPDHFTKSWNEAIDYHKQQLFTVCMIPNKYLKEVAEMTNEEYVKSQLHGEFIDDDDKSESTFKAFHSSSKGDCCLDERIEIFDEYNEREFLSHRKIKK